MEAKFFPFSITVYLEKIKTEVKQDNDKEMENFITYNYKTESFEYNFIPIIKMEDEDNKSGSCKMFCLMIHFIYKILNFNLIKMLRNNLTENAYIYINY